MNYKTSSIKFISLIAALFFIFTNAAPVQAFQNNTATAYDPLHSAPSKPNAEIIELLGRYENIKNTKECFLILEDFGTLKMLQNEIFNNITPESENFHRPTNGKEMYAFKLTTGGSVNTIEFTRSETNKKFYCSFNGNIYRQVIYGGENGGTYKITPLKAIGELRKIAHQSRPPYEADATAECDLLNLREIGGGLIFDIRYATDNNFMGEKFYETPGAFLQKPAAYALLYVANSLSRHGLGMIVYDAYRPWYVTKMFYDATPDAQKNFVADPSKGSRHNRGTAIDVGLYDFKTGNLIDMGSGYDEFSERASPKFQGATSYSRWHRKLLEHYMNKAGFTVYEDEWWHFDYKLNIIKYPLINKAFEQIIKDKK